jgi:Glycosyl transferases group 1
LISAPPPAGPPSVSPDLLARITSRFGAPRTLALPEAGPDGDHSAAFAQLRRDCRGADAVLFPAIAPGHLDRFFQMRLAQVVRWEPPLPAVSIVVLTQGQDGPKLAGGFAERFRSGWPFAKCVFVTETEDAAALSARLGLPVEAPDANWTPLSSDAQGSQKIAVQFQRIWGRCGSTTGFENQVESLVRAGFLTIRVFTDATLRRGATLAARLAEIIPENSDHAGAHIDVVAVPDGPPIPVRATSHDSWWAGWLAATATCRVLDPAIAEVMKRADQVVANHLEGVGPALALTPRARLMLDVRDDRVRSTTEMMRRDGKPEAQIAIVEAATSRAQAAVLAIPDICGHVSASEFESLGRHCPRSVIMLPRVYANPSPAPDAPRFDALIFGDEHKFNIASLRWFLEEVWQPHLATAGVSVAIAGRVGDHVRDHAKGSMLLHFLGFVDDLDALRSACRLTVVPDRHGSGTAVKTLATLASGHPLVSTLVGVRGLDPSVAGILAANDDPLAMAADILELLRDPDALLERRRMVERAHTAINRGPDHAALLRQIPRPTPRVIREREAKWARLTAAAVRPDPKPYHFLPGKWFAMSGSAWDHLVLLDGWHGAEAWGRWTDGAVASMRLPLAAPADVGLVLELDIERSLAGGTLAISVDDASFDPIQPAPGPIAFEIPYNVTRTKNNLLITLRGSETVRPAQSGASSDTRILGIGVNRVRVVLSDE